jgi:pimeloyl-ACP methyl ester carboxylesterase
MLFSAFTKKLHRIALLFTIGTLLLASVNGSVQTKKKSMKDQKNVDLYYESRGAGAPIVLLHGFGANIYTWRHLIEPLSKQHELIMIDLKGFGKSPKPRDKHYEGQDQANLIFKFIVAHKLTNLTLIGHSFGGGVALLTALRLIKEQPNCLKRLVLIDAAAYEQDLPYFIDILRTPLLGRLAVSLLSNKQQVRLVLKKSYYDDSKITDDQVDAYAAPLESAGGSYALARTAKSIVPRDIQQISARYKAINVPSLILWGRQDKVVPFQFAERLHHDLAASALVVIENCGHIPHEEKPEDAIPTISAFLNAHPSMAPRVHQNE